MRLEEFRWRESLKQREAQRAKREAVARWCHFNLATTPTQITSHRGLFSATVFGAVSSANVLGGMR